MKIYVTINLGNYENIKIESSENDTVRKCKAELNSALRTFKEPRMEDLRHRLFAEM